jgi:RimJ/RimL family protein N-acetyltransferase
VDNSGFHKPTVITKRLQGYVPQKIFFEMYCNMFHDPDFVACYGIYLTQEQIMKILERDISYWEQYGFGPYVWFDKETKEFVGEGGLNHTIADNQEEIELTYSLSKSHWGRGFAVEIGEYSIEQAFNVLHLDNIVCFTIPSNYQSLRVMEKLGFQYEKDFIHMGLPHKLFRLKNQK